VSEEHNCPRCNAPLLYFTGGNRNFQCCGYASQLQERIKRLEEAGDALMEIVEGARFLFAKPKGPNGRRPSREC